jgi:hypothetical protein
MTELNIAVEGTPDRAAAAKIAQLAGFKYCRFHGGSGKARLDLRVSAYNHAAGIGPWLVLRDLDHDADCGPELRSRLLPSCAPLMCLRIVVRELEAWMMADRESFSSFFAIAESRLPHCPDDLHDPKQLMLNLIRKSRSRDLREDMLPRPESRAKEGSAYTSTLSEYVTSSWNPHVAARSPSLERAIRAIAVLADRVGHDR